MRYAILLVCLMLLVATPATSGAYVTLKLGGLPAQVSSDTLVSVGVKAVTFGPFAPERVIVSGHTITLELFFFGCPITCGPDHHDFQMTVGQLTPGDYTISAEVGGLVFDTIELEVVPADD